MLAAHASRLQAEALGQVLEGLLVGAVLGDVGELPEDGLALAGTHVGGAGRDDAVDGVLCELDSSFFHLC